QRPVVLPAGRALAHVPLEATGLTGWREAVTILCVTFPEFGASHRRKCTTVNTSPGSFQVGRTRAKGQVPLLEQRRNHLRKAVSGAIKSALYRAQIATRDLRNLGVALSLELPQHEDRPMVGGQLPNTLIDGFLQEALPVQIVWAGGRVLELQWPVVGLPILLDRLEEHQRIPAAVAQLVLRQVRRDRIDPGRKFLGLIEPVQMPEHPDKDFLHQVFRALAVA